MFYLLIFACGQEDKDTGTTPEPVTEPSEPAIEPSQDPLLHLQSRVKTLNRA